MSDKFLPALAELKEALGSGEEVQTSLHEIAQEHGLPMAALENRARLAYGDLPTFYERALEEKARVEKDLEYDRARRHITTMGGSATEASYWKAQWYKAWRKANPIAYERLCRDEAVRNFQSKWFGFKY